MQSLRSPDALSVAHLIYALLIPPDLEFPSYLALSLIHKPESAHSRVGPSRTISSVQGRPSRRSLSAAMIAPPFPDDVPTHPLFVIDYSLILQDDEEEKGRLWDAATQLGFW